MRVRSTPLRLALLLCCHAAPPRSTVPFVTRRTARAEHNLDAEARLSTGTQLSTRVSVPERRVARGSADHTPSLQAHDTLA